MDTTPHTNKSHEPTGTSVSHTTRASASSAHSTRTGVHPKVSVKVSAQASVTHSQQQAEDQSMSVVRKSLIFLMGVGCAYALYLVFSGQIDEFVEAMRGVDTTWIFLGMLCYLVYYISGVFAYVLAVVGDKKCHIGVRDLMSVEASGIFFYNLTPNGAGGPPSQIFRLIRAGLSVGAAGALQYTRFIIYEAGEGIFAALMLLFRWNYFVETYGNVFVIGGLLFGFKILEVFLLFAVCLWPSVIAHIGRGFLRIMACIPALKKRVRTWDHVLETQIIEFSEGFKTAAQNMPEMMITLLVTLFQLGCLYALPWFVLHAFGLPADLITCLACGSMLELLTSAIPLPGGTFGAEGGFAFLFAPMFGSYTPAGYVLWRMIEFFLPILATVPLLGLRSRSGISIYTRWHRMRQHLRRLYSEIVEGKHTPASQGVKVKIASGGKVVIKSQPGVKHAAISSDYVSHMVPTSSHAPRTSTKTAGKHPQNQLQRLSQTKKRPKI